MTPPPPPLKNQRPRGSRVAWVPKNKKKSWNRVQAPESIIEQKQLCMLYTVEPSFNGNLNSELPDIIENFSLPRNSKSPARY